MLAPERPTGAHDPVVAPVSTASRVQLCRREHERRVGTGARLHLRRSCGRLERLAKAVLHKLPLPTWLLAYFDASKKAVCCSIVFILQHTYRTHALFICTCMCAYARGAYLVEIASGAPCLAPEEAGAAAPPGPGASEFRSTLVPEASVVHPPPVKVIAGATQIF